MDYSNIWFPSYLLLPGNAPANLYLLKGDGKKTPKESKFNLDNLAVSFGKNSHGLKIKLSNSLHASDPYTK